MSFASTLIAGAWRAASVGSEVGQGLRSVSPLDRSAGAELYPRSSWAELSEAADAAWQAFVDPKLADVEARARFLELYADRLQAKLPELAQLAHRETALPYEPRLAQLELPRTINQLRAGATAARTRSWALPTIDAKLDIRSMLAPVGPVLAFGPNNFPFACNAVCGGDFTAAVAVGCPIVAKANPGHPALALALAREGFAALQASDLPPATFQFFFDCAPEDGLRLVRHPRIAAVGFTGSKTAGLAFKEAADAVGKPIFLEMGSVNPVVILPGALAERFDAVVQDYVASCLLGTGQFCTNPGLVFLLAGPSAERFLAQATTAFRNAPNGPLLGERVKEHLEAGVRKLRDAGTELRCGGGPAEGPGFHFQNTLLSTTGKRFLADPAALQSEAFGNASLVVVCDSETELTAALEACEGSLTGCFVTGKDGSDDAAYRRLEPILRRKVGRLLNDKMPTGVTVSSGTNHGGPFPAAWPPQFTAIGIPGALRRFTTLQCYDNVRQERLPVELRNRNLSPPIFRYLDGEWTTRDVG